MRCRELVELLTECLDGALSARDRERLRAHLRTCAGCREYVAQFRRTIDLIGLTA